MKILVCIKQVLESRDAIEIDAESARIRTDPSAAYKMNPFDEFAVEEGLRIRESVGRATVDVLSVGPDRAAVVVRRAMGMGADHGIHVLDREDGNTDPFRIASLIAHCAKDRGYDLILAGVMAEDDLQGTVGPMTAELLTMPCATATIKTRLSQACDEVFVERELEGGIRDALELRLPALLTIQSGINRPRYPSLSNILRAKGQRLETVETDAFEPPYPRQGIARLAYPEKSRSATVLEGTPKEKAKRLIHILEERHLLRR